VGFARLNATKLYRLKGTIVKINMTEYHFSKSANLEIYIYKYLHKKILIRVRISLIYLEITSVLAVKKCTVFVLTIFPRTSKRCTIVLFSKIDFGMSLVFPRSQKFQVFRTPYHKTIKTEHNIE